MSGARFNGFCTDIDDDIAKKEEWSKEFGESVRRMLTALRILNIDPSGKNTTRANYVAGASISMVMKPIFFICRRLPWNLESFCL
jgi:hypothetical protein